MIATIHQPEHLPWTGFFHKMMCADIYIYLDHVQYKKGNVQNRNRIIGQHGDPIWVTVPLKRSGSMQDTIMAKEITDNAWTDKYLSSIQLSYQDTRYFGQYFEKLRKIICDEHSGLADLNIKIIDFFRRELDINTPVVRSSNLNVSGSKSDLIVDICKQVKAESYITGPAGLDYLDLDLFDKNNIELFLHQYVPPVYEAGCFFSGLSTLDLLFNQGERSRNIIQNSGNIQKVV